MKACPGLERDGQDDKPETSVERGVQFLRFPKEQHGDDDAVHRLEIIGKVHGEGGNTA